MEDCFPMGLALEHCLPLVRRFGSGEGSRKRGRGLEHGQEIRGSKAALAGSCFALAIYLLIVFKIFGVEEGRV